MQLEKLTLTDIGVFSGKQTFDLTPRKRNEAKRPIILFGGLNGAGKTTFLTAIRLVLYGRHSVESGSTQKQYESFLQKMIHRPVDSLVRATAASISLEFTYARLGERTRYRILRTWQERSLGVEEHLRVFRNEEEEEVLAGEQAQAFLNQLIPSGISQFFFFDGEKIAALAHDDSDFVLADAIRRLLGLDLADRLNSDLSVFLRQKRSETFDDATRKQIVEIEQQLKTIEVETDTDLNRLDTELGPALDTARTQYERRRNELMDRGGAWAVNRSELEQNLDRLKLERHELEEKLREQLSSLAIFTLAPNLSSSVIQDLEQTQVASERRAVSKIMKQQVSILKARLSTLEKLQGSAQRAINTCIDSWANELSTDNQHKTAETEYGFSDAEARSAIAALSITAPSAQRELAIAYFSTRKIEASEEKIQQQLAHAPSEESLQEAFSALTLAAKEVAAHEAARKQLIEETRRKTWQSIDLTRKLKKLLSLTDNESSDVKSESIAASLQEMISDFKIQSAIEKCNTLKYYFIAAFLRLSRKGQIVLDARIDPNDFSVTLLDRNGNDLPKSRLSAGEKQIYAIAMLEALAKTSGRNLPIIIDTPLGRLDSQHRQKLVESYFPIASHQVIVLSTDTEVDFSFYQGLQPHISHAYNLSFDERAGATKVSEEYFWKSFSDEGKSHAA